MNASREVEGDENSLYLSNFDVENRKEMSKNIFLSKMQFLKVSSECINYKLE